MSNPKVSVCVVTFNHSRFIDACLSSALSQTTSFPFEVVVADDCSTDDTPAKLVSWQRRYPDQIKLLLRSANIGVLENFRGALDALRGNYIAHLDGDDAMLPGKLQKQVDVLDNEPDIAIVAHDMIVIDDSTCTRGVRYSAGLNPPARGTLDDLVRDGSYFCHSSKMFRRECIKHVPLDTRTHHVPDLLFHIQNACLGSIRYLDEVLGEYRRHGGGISSSVDRDYLYGILSDQIYTVDRALELGASAESANAGLNRIYYSMSLRCLGLGLHDDFRRLIARSTGFYSIKHRLYYFLRGFPLMLRGIEWLRTKVKK